MQDVAAKRPFISEALRVQTINSMNKLGPNMKTSPNVSHKLISFHIFSTLPFLPIIYKIAFLVGHPGI